MNQNIYKINHAITIILLSLILCSCQQNNTAKKINVEEEKVNVKMAIQHSIAWAKEKNNTLLYSIIADDKNYLEVHSRDNVVVGINNFRKAEKFWLDDRFKHIGFETWDIHITLSKNGEVAWYYCMLNDFNEWDG